MTETTKVIGYFTYGGNLILVDKQTHDEDGWKSFARDMETTGHDVMFHDDEVVVQKI